MTGTPRRLLGLLLLATVVGCKPNELNGVINQLRFDPPGLRFETAYADGITRSLEVNVVNDGRATLEVHWAGVGKPFAVALPATLPPGATLLTVDWTTQVAGRFSQLLEVSAEGLESASLAMDASANALPVCVPSSPCVTARFDLESQTCVQVPVEDGLGCDPGTLCMESARCEAGRCVGTAKTCSDGNACTIDVCYPQTGCEFLPAPPCPGDGACLEGTCDPSAGCGLKPREDGASCGRASFQTLTTGPSTSARNPCGTFEPTRAAMVSADEPAGIVIDTRRESHITVTRHSSRLPLRNSSLFSSSCFTRRAVSVESRRKRGVFAAGTSASQKITSTPSSRG